MSSRSADNATSVTTALGWFGLAIIAFLAVWELPKESLSWWIKIVAGLAGALAFAGYGIEALSQELTLRRWAISQAIFTAAGVAFLIAGILDSQPLGFGRALCFIGAAVYLIGALFCAAAGKELF